MNIEELIKPELTVLIPVLYLIGVVLKKSRVADHLIPATLGTVSVLLALVWTFATSEIRCLRDAALALFTAVTQGVLIAGGVIASANRFKRGLRRATYRGNADVFRAGNLCICGGDWALRRVVLCTWQSRRRNCFLSGMFDELCGIHSHPHHRYPGSEHIMLGAGRYSLRCTDQYPRIVFDL